MSLFHFCKAKPHDALAISNLIIPLVEEFISHEYIEQGCRIVLGTMSQESIQNNMESGFEYFIARNALLPDPKLRQTKNQLSECSQ